MKREQMWIVLAAVASLLTLGLLAPGCGGGDPTAVPVPPAQEQGKGNGSAIGTPEAETADVSPRPASVQRFRSASTGGPDVAVLAYCMFMEGDNGAQNTVDTLVADGRFGSVTLIDGDVVGPTAQDLLDHYDGVLAMTNNHCGIPIPQALADGAADALTGFAQGSGGVVLCTFGFSHLASGGIGFGASIFGPGLSPFQQALPRGNAPSGNLDLANACTDPPCDRLLDGVTAPVSSSYANYVSLSAGATLCASYTNGQPFLAINATGKVVALNTFPASRLDNNQASYRRLVANAVYTVSEITVSVDIKPTTCPNLVNVKSRGILPVAILGTDHFDVTRVDVATVALTGVAPRGSAWEDVATPRDENEDCIPAGPDGRVDLLLRFDTQEVIAALGEVEDGEEQVLELTGRLLEEYGRTRIVGADGVLILKKGKE